MAGEPRVWADVDRTWLQDYVKKRNLASEYELDDVLIGSQVSSILDAKEWAKLRDAWQEEQQSTGIVRDTVQAPVAEELPAATERVLESADARLIEEDEQTAAGSEALEKTTEPAVELGVAATKTDDRPEDSQRMHELAQKALSDWGAFKELFLSCPEVQGAVGRWETLADSPVAMLMQAEELIRRQDAEAREHRDQLEREREGEVNRAQNIIAGYYSYCEKNRIVPSMERLLVLIPVLRAEFSPDAVKEAWRREAERRKR